MKKALTLTVCLMAFCIFDMAHDDFDEFEFEEMSPIRECHGTRGRVQQKLDHCRLG